MRTATARLAAGERLKRGLAFVYPPTGTEARRAQAGIWADAAYADAPADKAWRKYGHFAFVAGTVLDAAQVKSMALLFISARTGAIVLLSPLPRMICALFAKPVSMRCNWPEKAFACADGSNAISADDRGHRSGTD